jgi:hypothetical protein
MSPSKRPFRVLSLDGGGMRGIYTAQYLSSLTEGFSKKRSCGTLDLVAGFDLIVGTSTGAILACALEQNKHSGQKERGGGALPVPVAAQAEPGFERGRADGPLQFFENFSILLLYAFDRFERRVA